MQSTRSVETMISSVLPLARPVSTNALSAAHFETSMPNGARNIPAIPTTRVHVRYGYLLTKPCMVSISLEPV